MKKFITFILAAAMVLSLAACGGSSSGSGSGSETEGATASSDFKVGVILVGDETEGYSAAHIDGIKEAQKELGLSDDQIIWKYKVPESQECYEAAVDLVGQGCSLIISNSYGHQTFMVQAAQEYPDVTFVSMTGDFAAISGCDNFKNAFDNIY